MQVNIPAPWFASGIWIISINGMIKDDNGESCRSYCPIVFDMVIVNYDSMYGILTYMTGVMFGVSM